MNSQHLLDPELHPLLDQPRGRFTRESLPGVRAARRETVAMGDAERAGVTRSEITVPGDPDVRCLMYTANDVTGKRPGYLHIHGGGYIVGAAEMSDVVNLIIARRLGVTILSVDYRLAPEHPYPAPVDDCYAALGWLFQNADDLQVDRDRIAIGGESAGGGLAAQLAIVARDRGQYPICHQHLTYPMLDSRTGSAEHPGDPLTGEFIWTRESNQFGWDCYLGGKPAAAPQVPAMLERYEGLPPTWMFTAALDLFRDENIAYAQNLLKAGVPTEIVLLPGACHGFQGVPGTRVGASYRAFHLDALGRALKVAVR